MTDCKTCPRLQTHPVTLITGAVVCSSCNAWRLECESRHMLKLSRDERLESYQRIAKKRGKAAAEALVQRVKRLAEQQGQGT